MCVLCFLDGQRPCMELYTLVVVCAGQLVPLARVYLSPKVEIGWIESGKELLLVISLEECPTPSLDTQD
jgi:hypothetical protein